MHKPQLPEAACAVTSSSRASPCGLLLRNCIRGAQRGSFHIIESQLAALKALFPIVSRLRMMRQWAGIVDVAPDASPIIGRTPVEGLYFNCGWGTGGFKAIPGSGFVFAHTVARDEPHPLAAPFALTRFASGRLVDEHGAAGVAH